ncbi:hypothetical protein KAR91_68760 [Candidatus Pacearchaeota archaeon]|nr:hypothetical protein [Candidatus Pacearchaeota archaeon]
MKKLVHQLQNLLEGVYKKGEKVDIQLSGKLGQAEIISCGKKTAKIKLLKVPSGAGLKVGDKIEVDIKDLLPRD